MPSIILHTLGVIIIPYKNFYEVSTVSYKFKEQAAKNRKVTCSKLPYVGAEARV